MLARLTGTDDLAEIVCGMNRGLCDIAAENLFATAVLLRVRPISEKVECVITGHDPPVLINPDGHGMIPHNGGMMLGVEADSPYSVTESELPQGGRMFLFTDGLHEAMSPKEEQFGRTRVSELFARTSHMPLESQLSAVLNDVRSFQEREDFDDDVTILAISRGDQVETNDTSFADAESCGQDAMRRGSQVD